MTTGRLLVVATPIGNLADLTDRARSAFADADVICCEDTRRTGALLDRIGIPAAGRLRAVHEHNEAASAPLVVRDVEAGRVVVYATDAGMPGISDPGMRVVRACIDAGVPLEVVPGPSAALTALVVSGLPSDRFRFEGFLARKGVARAAQLEAIATADASIVVFEAPSRVARTLRELARVCGGARPAAVVRELTKLHEEHWRGSLSDLAERAEADAPRGEVVIVVGAQAPSEVDDAALASALRDAFDTGATTRDAAALVATQLGVARGRAYEMALALRADEHR